MVLLVEDDPQVTRALERLLRAEFRIRIDHVTTGQEAIACATGLSYDLLILDLGLPDLDGIDVARSIRGAGCVSPILVITGEVALPGGATLEAELAPFAWEGKPFTSKDLYAKIRRLVPDIPSREGA